MPETDLSGSFTQFNEGVFQGLQDGKIPTSRAPCYGVITVIIFQGNHFILHTCYAAHVSGGERRSKIPNFKHQNPKKFEYPMTKSLSGRASLASSGSQKSEA